MSFSHVWPSRKNITGIPVFYRRHFLETGNSQAELLFCQQGNRHIAKAFIDPHLITSIINSKYEKCQPSEIEVNQGDSK